MVTPLPFSLDRDITYPVDTDRRQPTPVHKLLHEQHGKQVRRARKAQGLTQGELAERIGREQNTISRIETGQSGVSDQTKIELCLALDKSLDDLFPWPIGLLDIAAYGRDAA